MSTISNERLEKLSEYDCADRYEVMSMATELLALRKERERAEPFVCPKCGNTGLADSGGVQPWGEPIFIDCDCRYTSTALETDTTSQQFESLAGKSVVPISYLQGHKDGLEWAARLAEANHPQASDWLYDDPLELAKAIRKGPDMPVSTVAGWIPCSERMPPENTGVLVATEFDGPGDWRMKWGTRVPGHPDSKNGWFIPGASWTPSHWQPLPEPPCK